MYHGTQALALFPSEPADSQQPGITLVTSQRGPCQAGPGQQLHVLGVWKLFWKSSPTGPNALLRRVRPQLAKTLQGESQENFCSNQASRPLVPWQQGAAHVSSHSRTHQGVSLSALTVAHCQEPPLPSQSHWSQHTSPWRVLCGSNAGFKTAVTHSLRSFFK